MTIYWTRHHHVTGDMENSTVEGDGSIHIWIDSDPATETSDAQLEEPANGFHWRTSLEGWEAYPNGFEEAIPESRRDETVERMAVADTSLVA